jgi:hypothetical protein
MPAAASARQSVAEVTNRRYEREQEGFGRTLGPERPERYEALRCGTVFFGVPDTGTGDSRGAYGLPVSRDRQHIEWETSAAEAAEKTVFTWMGGSRVWPAMTPAFPYHTAALSVDGRAPLRFPLGRPEGFHVAGDGISLEFEPRQFHSLSEAYHRYFDAAGITGFFRLHVDGRLLTRGKPVRLRVELDRFERVETTYHVIPRNDCLAVDLRILRDEIAVLQRELVAFKRSHEQLAAQLYPELFPERVPGERVIVTQDPIKHLHPATITGMSDGELVVTMREGTDHLSTDGRIMLVRSRDGGRTWGKRELMFDLGRCDHRSSPILELPNGDWVATDYRAGVKGGVYDEEGVRQYRYTAPSMWGAWSTDRGRSWSFSKDPFAVPGAPSPFGEVERHMIRLPSGRLLVGSACATTPDSIKGVAVFASDDNGRSWSFLSKQEADPRIEAEATLLRCRSGKILMLVRTVSGVHHPGLVPDWRTSGCLLQCESHDEGRTWTPYQDTTLSSLHTPGHLLQLQDGRILCSHASRSYPGSIYVTTSSDEGRTWGASRVIANDQENFDNTYPTTAQLKDGTLVTVWYANRFGKFFIAALRYPASAI